MIERISSPNFLRGIERDVDLAMIAQPRSNSYIRMDGWDG